MSRHLAPKTLLQIEQMIQADQGAKFRTHLGEVIGHMGDAYSSNSFPFRSHMGASGIGNSCARAIWYGFRWTARPVFGGRLLRLFNRGHLEEARFLAMLLMIGCQVYQQDEEGNQFRISDAGGHFGGSGDGVAIGIPDLEPNSTALLEFKTASDKKFKEMVKKGCEEANFTYYVQMQVYMRKMGIPVALFMMVNKNDDDLYAELVPFNAEVADKYINRGVELVWMDIPPKKISESPGWFECKWCDYNKVCHLSDAPDKNCRTCIKSVVEKDGTWSCNNIKSDNFTATLTKEQQLEGCKHYRVKFQ